MASSLYDLIVNITTSTASLETGMNRAADIIGKNVNKISSQLDEINSKFKAVGSAIGAIAGLTVAGFGIKAFSGLIEGAIEAQAQLFRLSQVTGFTVESLSAIKSAAKIVGVDFDAATAALTKLDKAMFQAATQGGAADRAFQGLGVGIKDLAGNLRAPNDVLLDIAKRFSEMENGATKSALAQQLFGKAGAALIPVLNELGDAAQYAGKVTTEQAAIADDLEKNWNRLQASGKGLWSTIAAAIAPALDALAKAFLQVINAGGGLREYISKLAADGTIQAWAQKAVFLFAEIADAIVDVTNVMQASATALKGSAEYIAGIAQVIYGGWLIATGQFQKGADLAATGMEHMRDGAISVRDVFANFQASTKFQDAVVGATIDMGKFSVTTRTGKTDVEAFGKVAKETFVNLAPAIESFQKALTGLSKTFTDTFAKSQLEGIKSAEDDLKRSYDRGIIDFQQYWDAKIALQKTALGIQERQLQDDISAQERLVASLQTNINNIDPKNFKTTEGYIKAVYEASGKLVEAFAGLVKSQAALNDVQQKGADIGKNYVEELISANSYILKSVRSLDEQIKQQQLENDAIGLTASGYRLLIAARLDDLVVQARVNNASAETIANLEAQADKQRELAGVIREGEIKNAWLDVFRNLADAGASFIEDFIQHGGSAFKRLWENFKAWALSAFAKIAATQLIISIFPQSANALGNPLGSFGTATGIGNTGGGGLLGGAGGISQLASLFGTGVGNTSQFGPILPTAGSQFFAGLSSPLTTLSTAFTEGAAAAGGFTAILGAAIPVVGTVLAGLSLFGSSLFNKKPSPTSGQFAVSAGTGGFEDNAFTSTAFGNVGFADAGTQQFSGQAAQVFNKIISGALDAFDQRYSAEQRDRLSSILQKTVFPNFEGTFSTEDFIKQYGGQILQQVVAAAFDVLDPALGAVARQFVGTADEISKFGNTLLSIYDLTKQIGNTKFTEGVDQALAGATQESADKILAFVGIVAQFGDSISGLGDVLEALDPSKITAFVDALGGAQQAASTFATFNQNFGTQARATETATARLTSVFGRFGLTVPTTHAQFVQIVEDFIAMGNTDAVAAILGVSDAFVTIHGTAEAARQALLAQAQAGQDYYNQHFLTPNEQLLQRQTVDSSALYEATKQGTLLNTVLNEFGLKTIPTTVDGVRDLVNATIAKYGADSDEARALLAIIPIIGDLIDSVDGFGDAAQAAADKANLAAGIIVVGAGSIIQQAVALAASRLKVFEDIANAGTGDFGSKLATQLSLIQDAIKNTDRFQFTTPLAYQVFIDQLRNAQTVLGNELGRFTVLSAQYDASRAEQLVNLEQWYGEQQQLIKQALGANATAALAALGVVFNQKWDAIVNGVSGALTDVAKSIDDFIKSIQDIANSTGGDAGQQARLELALSSAKLDTLQTQYAAALPGSALANSILSDINKLQAYNAGLATQIDHFTIYSAKYGKTVANQLIDLENQFAGWQQAVAGNADALAVVTEIFNEKFQSIIDGISAGADQLKTLKQNIADYLKGLFVSEISPLTARQKLDQARLALDQEILLAKGGDPKALGDVTQFFDTFIQLDRAFKTGTQGFVDDFNFYTQQLGDLAGTLPTGQPLDSTAAIAAVLPTNGQLASNEDLKAEFASTRALLQRLIEDLANANTADSIEEREALAAGVDKLTAALGGSELK